MENKLVIPPRPVVLSDVQIKRLLPYREKRMVGPFIYFDHFPSTEFVVGHSINVHPHPHIGLSTLSYLIEGQILHHDSLDNTQVLLPGDVNWMTAGKGIAHSERVPEELKGKTHRQQLLQFWVALPKEQEDRDPSFFHHAKERLPHIEKDGLSIKLIAGSAFGQTSPVEVFSELFFMDVQITEGKTFTFDPQDQELAFYVLGGKLQHQGEVHPEFSFVVIKSGEILTVTAMAQTQFVVLGGKAFPEERFIFWNFVSSSKDKIEAAKKAWREGNFPHVPRETDEVPVPDVKSTIK